MHHVLLEVLKELNRAETEETEVEGMERNEIFVILRKGPTPWLTEAALDSAIETLLGNGMTRRIEEPAYAWDRGRVLGARFALTLPGKEYLLRELERTGRVE
jgi:hypothetical protein